MRIKITIFSILLISLFLTFGCSSLTTLGSSNQKKIPKAAFKVKGHHYYLMPMEMNYYTAIDACGELGGHILSIDSQQEYDYFHKYAIKNGKTIWLDLTDRKEEGRWLNWRGEDAKFLKWSPGEPNMGDRQNYMVLNWANQSRDMDDMYNTRFAVICEWEY
ncbi:MAG: C-type lectin domain-containing protein [Candidatus Hodarchaeota archaeon]